MTSALSIYWIGIETVIILLCLAVLFLITRWVGRNQERRSYALPEIVWIAHTLIFWIVILSATLRIIPTSQLLSLFLVGWWSLINMHGVMMIGVYYLTVRENK